MKTILCLFLAAIVLIQCGVARPSKKKALVQNLKTSKAHVKAIVLVDSSNRPAETDEDRRCYFGNILYGAMKKLATLGLGLTVDVLDFLVEEGNLKASFLQFYPSSIYNLELRVNSALTKSRLPGWMKAKGKNLTMYNVALVFTRYKVNDYDVASTLGSICEEELPVVIVTDRGLWSSTDATAHGLAHSLGARRDGEQNNCSSETQNIMTPKRTRNEEESYENRLKFSDCTKSYISTFLKKRKIPTCLKKPKTKSKLSFRKQCQYKYPGQRFPWQRQCVYAVGWYSRPCIGTYNSNQNICKVLYCYSRHTERCEAIVPVDGTSCGDGKWCIKGECINGKTAPKHDGKCEDRHEANNLLMTVDGQKTCSYIKNGHVGICDHDYFSQWCCRSCGKKN